MKNRTKAAFFGASALALGYFTLLPTSQAADIPKAGPKFYACKNLTTLVPRIVANPSSCTLLETAIAWDSDPETGTEFPYICDRCNLNDVPAFSGRDLAGAWIKGSNMNNISLVDTNLTGANLSSGTYLSSDFSGANLTNVDFSDTDLSYAVNMASATRDGITWSNTTCPDGTNSEMNSGTCEGHLNP